MKPLFRRSKKTLADSKSLERIGLDFDERKDRQTLVSFSPPRFSDRKKPQEIPQKESSQISTRGKIDEPFFRFHPLVSTKKNLSRFEIPYKESGQIFRREERSLKPFFRFHPLVSTKKNLSRFEILQKESSYYFDERKDRQILVSFSSPRFDD